MSPSLAATAIKCCSRVVTLARILCIGWSFLFRFGLATSNDNKGVLAYLVCAPSRAQTGGVSINDLKKTGMSGGWGALHFDGRNIAHQLGVGLEHAPYAGDRISVAALQ